VLIAEKEPEQRLINHSTRMIMQLNR